MDRPALSIAYLAMEAAWLGGLIAVWGGWIEPGQRAALLPLGAVWLTLAAGFVAGSQLLRPERGGDGGGRPAGPWPALALLVGVLWSFGVVWLSRHAGAGTGRLAGLAESLGTIWAGPSPDLAALLAAFFLWWRGQRAGAEPPDYATVVHSFGLGSLLLSAALVAGAISLGTPPALAAATPLFLAGGLAALTQARLYDVRSDLEAGAASGSAPRLSAGWARAAIPPVVLVLLVAAAAAVLLGDEASRAALVAALGTLWLALWNVFYWPLVLVGYVAEGLIILLRHVPLPQPRGQQPQLAPDPFAELRRLAERETAAPPGWAGALRWVALAIAVALVGTIFLATSRVIRRERAAPARPVDERESLWSWGGAWSATLVWLRTLLGGWRARAQALVAGAPARGPRDRHDEAAGDVRAVYRRVLALGRAHGLARPAAQTPREYREAWREALPGEAEVEQVTAAYQQVRYGKATSAAPPAAPLHAALARLIDRLTSPEVTKPRQASTTPRRG